MTYMLFLKVINEKTNQQKVINTKFYTLNDLQKTIDTYKQAGYKLKCFTLKNFTTSESEI